MKVLLVDDAAFVRMSLKKILDDMAFGFRVYRSRRRRRCHRKI